VAVPGLSAPTFFQRLQVVLEGWWTRLRERRRRRDGRRQCTAARPVSQPAPKRQAVALALQGGGAHGAFTWGVLDGLLAADRFDIRALSGTSAGAFNAVLLAHGLLHGQGDGARDSLARFWARIGASSDRPPKPFDGEQGWPARTAAHRPLAHIGLDLLSWFTSPYQFNPFDLHPLRTILAETVDFERLRRNRRIKLFIAATDVRRGRPRVFETAELTPDVVLASAALPALYRAVEIDGDHYWDGGYTTNPPILPLILGSNTEDILLVQIEPDEEGELPITGRQIKNRLQRLTFSRPLTQELATLTWLRASLAAETDSRLARRLQSLRLHRIEAFDALGPLDQASKLNTEQRFLDRLFDLGHRQADLWLRAHGDMIGSGGTYDPSSLA